MAGTTSSVILALMITAAPAVPPAAPPQPPEAWTIDQPERRPAALPLLYASLGAMHALDVYSTRRAIDAGADESNPMLGTASRHTGAMLAVKAVSTAATVFFAERAWKKNRKGAVILMVAINGAMVAVNVRNLRNARAAGR